MYMIQNAGVAASAAAVFPLLAGSAPHGGLWFWALTCVTIACGALSSVGSMVFCCSHRDWHHLRHGACVMCPHATGACGPAQQSTGVQGSIGMFLQERDHSVHPLNQGSTLAVEREWTKALCGGDSEALAAMNSGEHRSLLDKQDTCVCTAASPQTLVPASYALTATAVQAAGNQQQ